MDSNLKLAIVSALITKKEIQFDRKKYLSNLGWTKYKINRFDYKPIDEIKNYFLNIDLSNFSVDKIDTLIDAPNDCSHAIWPAWDGEDDYFNIKNLDGISVCPNIKSLHIRNLETDNLLPIMLLKQLEVISIEMVDIIINLDVFFNIPTLKNLYLASPSSDKDYFERLKTYLTQKGVSANFLSWAK